MIQESKEKALLLCIDDSSGPVLIRRDERSDVDAGFVITVSVGGIGGLEDAGVLTKDGFWTKGPVCEETVADWWGGLD